MTRRCFSLCATRWLSSTQRKRRGAASAAPFTRLASVVGERKRGRRGESITIRSSSNSSKLLMRQRLLSTKGKRRTKTLQWHHQNHPMMIKAPRQAPSLPKLPATPTPTKLKALALSSLRTWPRLPAPNQSSTVSLLPTIRNSSFDMPHPSLIPIPLLLRVVAIPPVGTAAVIRQSPRTEMCT